MTDVECISVLVVMAISGVMIGYLWAMNRNAKALKEAKRFGRVHHVANKQRKFGSQNKYKAVRVIFSNLKGSGSVLLLTDNEYYKASERAKSNPEDVQGI